MMQAPPLSPRPPQGAQSFLVRVWVEPQAATDAGHVRAYVRDLRTGDETYARDAAGLAACLGWQGGWGRTPAVEPAPRNEFHPDATSD
jgi:hypothetical protein